jgi:L-threonylcarbamoyladenylate synthase
MRRIDIESGHAVSKVTSVLARDGVVILPTDTIYGLSAPIASRAGYEQVVSLKRGETERRFIYLADSIEMVSRYVAGWGCASEEALRQIWPAALTAILPSGREVPDWVGESIAFRVPESPELRAIIGAVGQPILSTSVNRSGEPPLRDVDAIAEAFDREVELMVIGEVDIAAAASTIVDFTGDRPRLIRRGGYAWPAAGNPSK